MGKAPKPRKVATPGSYSKEPVPVPVSKRTASGSSTPRGRPKAKKLKGTARKDNYRTLYSSQDMEEAVRLVTEEQYSISAAAKFTNSVKKAAVPRMSLSDRLRTRRPAVAPEIGRPKELSPQAEEAIVKCLEMCGSFQYPMKRRDLQNLVQSYCTENSVETRWKDNKPGREWLLHFRKRWAHRIKLRKPTNIKRSRAKVSPALIKEFFARLQPNLQDIPPSHIFNYDETNLRDDPGTIALF